MRRRRRDRRRERIKLAAICVALAIAAVLAGGGIARIALGGEDGQRAEGGVSLGSGGAPAKDPSGTISGGSAQRGPETGGDPAVPQAPAVRADGWALLLVNPWHPIPDGFSVELTQLRNGHAVDARAYPDLQEMMDAMRAEGLDPLICSSYRTEEKQRTLFENKVGQYLAQGYSQAEAEAEAGKWVAVPGTSEHQTGLAVDIVDMSYQLLDEGQEDTAVQQWLMENSYKYGFILRYPEEKSELTGIYYEPWHYRHVGREVAAEIFELGLCLEEYLSMRGR